MVEEYTNWLLSRVRTRSYKDNIKKARDIALENCLNLRQISRESPDFFSSRGVKIGVACMFVSDTPLWMEDRKRNKIIGTQMAIHNVSEEVHGIMNDHLRCRLDRIFTGSFIQAELAAQHQDIKDLLNANQRLNRKKTRRSIQTDGVLSVKDTSYHIKARSLEEMHKTARRVRRDWMILEKEKERLANQPPFTEAEKEALEGFMVYPDGEPLIYKDVTGFGV